MMFISLLINRWLSTQKGEISIVVIVFSDTLSIAIACIEMFCLSYVLDFNAFQFSAKLFNSLLFLRVRLLDSIVLFTFSIGIVLQIFSFWWVFRKFYLMIIS